MRGVLCQSLHINVHVATVGRVLYGNLDNALFCLLCCVRLFPFRSLRSKSVSIYPPKGSIEVLLDLEWR